MVADGFVVTLPLPGRRRPVLVRGRRPRWYSAVCAVGLVGIARAVLVLVPVPTAVAAGLYLACVATSPLLGGWLSRGGPDAGRIASAAMGVISIVLVDLIAGGPAPAQRISRFADAVAPAVAVLAVVAPTVTGQLLCRLRPDRGRQPARPVSIGP